MANEKNVVLGSGKLFITEATVVGGVITVPEDATIEVEANRIGAVSGGATLTYKPTFYTAEDDLGEVKVTRLQKEEVTLKSGIMKWNYEALQKLASTARSTIVKGITTIKLGGTKNDDGKVYIVRFLHEDAAQGDIRITIAGSNTSGFELAFSQDKETVVDMEFAAHPIDAEGTLVLYSEGKETE